MRSSIPLLLAVLWAPTAGHAQPSDAAEALRTASARLDAGDAAGAIEVLESARADAPSDRLELNLAIARAAHGEVARAARSLRRLVATSGDPLVRDAAREQLTRFEPRLATLVVAEGELTRAGRLTIDGRRAGGGGRVLVDPGPHVVEIRDPEGAVLASAAVDVEAGETRDVELQPPPSSEAPQPVARRRREPARRSTPLAPAAVAASTAQPPAPEPRAPTAPALATEPTEGDGGVDDAVWWAVGGAATAAVVTAIVVGVAVSSSNASLAPGDAPPIVVGGTR